MFTCCCTEATDKSVEIKLGDGLEEEKATSTQKRALVKAEPAITNQEEPASEEATPEQKKEVQEFTAELDVEQEQPVGIAVDTTCEAFPIIRSVSGTAEGEQIKPYDRLLRLDGQDIECSSAMQKLSIKGKTKIQLTLQRPIEMDVVLKRPGSLGVTINYKKSTMGLFIVAIPPGLMDNWNKENPSKAVKAYDRIIAVNGKSGAAEKLCEMMRGEGDRMVLTVLSY